MSSDLGGKVDGNILIRIIHNVAFPSVEPDYNLPSRPFGKVRDLFSTANSPGRAVKGSQQMTLIQRDLLAPETLDPLTDLLDEVMESRIVALYAHHRREHAVVFTGHKSRFRKSLDLIKYLVLIADKRQMIDPG